MTMDSRFNCSLWIFSVILSLSFIACSKEEEPIFNEEIIEINHPVYVSEAEQGDYKNMYSYERVDGKIRLKQIDLFKLGVKRYDLKLRYDDQNRLIECKRSVSVSDYYYHENKILNEYLPSDYSIQYDTNKLTVTDNDDVDNTKTYKLGNDGFVQEISWNYKGKSQVMTLKRSNDDFIAVDYTLSSDWTHSLTSYIFAFDEKKSVDYLRMILPCLYSDHNILRTIITSNGEEISRISYACTYNSSAYPVIIQKNETIIKDGTVEESQRTRTTLSYISADNI